MLKKVLACSVVTMFILCGSVISTFASDHGPKDKDKDTDIIIMEDSTSSKPKPAKFPHQLHKDTFSCDACHHGMDDDGKLVAYTDGMEIQKCATCHNAEVLPGKMKDRLKLDTLKGAGHGNCLECHREMAKKDPALKERKIASCSTCHPKNL